MNEDAERVRELLITGQVTTYDALLDRMARDGVNTNATYDAISELLSEGEIAMSGEGFIEILPALRLEDQSAKLRMITKD